MTPRSLWRDLVADEALAIVPIELAASVEAKSLVLGNLQTFQSNPAGLVILIPAGVTLNLPWWSLAIRDNWGLRPGARIVFRGEGGGPRPILRVPGDEGLIGVSADRENQVSIEFENLLLSAGQSGAVLNAINVQYLSLTDCVVSGGKFGLLVPTGPTRVLIQRTRFLHGGRGDGLTHNAYLNYVAEFTALDSQFMAARAEGHALKCYAADTLIAGCEIGGWQTEDDRRQGFTGLLAPLDVGAWATSTIVNNRFVRRGPARPYFMEYRNRQWPPGENTFAPDIGTKLVDWRRVDNRDPDNPYLFRHLLANNRFENGVTPDGGRDPAIVANPGIVARNDGSGAWASEGIPDPKPPKPAGFQPWNERAVVYTLGNSFTGVPFTQTWDPVPYQCPNDLAPFRALAALPAWARLPG